MAVSKARTLDDQQLTKLLKRIMAETPRPKVELTAFLLSFKAGLRVQEIAGLEWDRHLLDTDGNLRTEVFPVPGSKGRIKRASFPVLWISEDIGKYGAERTLRIHPMLADALQDLRAERLPSKFVIPSARASASQDLRSRAHALKMRINRIYDRLGYEGCTTHSGRRTFITQATRKANFAHCSIKDVQQLAGHKQLTTTEEYIDVTPSQADLVAML